MNQHIRIKLEIPAAHRFLNVLSGVLGELLNRVDDVEDRDTVTYQLQLAAQEVCTNIVDHAYADNPDGQIEIHIDVDEGAHVLNMTFGDTGAAYETGIPSILTIEEPSEGGMGLFLIRQLVDYVDYQRDGSWNVWKISKKLA